MYQKYDKFFSKKEKLTSFDIFVIFLLIVIIIITIITSLRKISEIFPSVDQTINKYRHIFNKLAEFIYWKANLNNQERISIFIEHPIYPGELLLIGRFSKYKNDQPTKIKLRIGKGAAGIAFSWGEPLYWGNLPSPQRNYDEYIGVSVNKFKLTEEEVKILGTKSLSFYAVPLYIKEKSDGVYGVVLIDSKNPTISERRRKKILEILDNDLLKLVIYELQQNLKKEFKK